MSMRRRDRIDNRRICGDYARDDQLRFDRTFDYSKPEQSYKITIKTDRGSSGSRKWGVKELLVYARLCHEFCG